GLGERLARERSRECGLYGGSELLRSIGRGECSFDSAGAVPRVQSHGGSGTIGPSGREGKPHGGSRDLGKGGGVFGLGAATQREPAAREQLEAVRPPAAGDERQLLTTGAAEEQFDSLFRLPGFEQDACEPHRSPCRNEALIEVTRELDALLCSGERDVQIADGDCDNGSVEEVPGKGRRRPEQPPGL